MSFDITSNDDLKTAVRADTSYEDDIDELPSSDLDDIIDNAKRRVALETDSEAWYTDRGLGHVLFAYTCMRAKAAVENAAIESYSLGDESVSVRNADPETSQQIQQWAQDVKVGLDASDVDDSTATTMKNSTSYIGDSYY